MGMIDIFINDIRYKRYRKEISKSERRIHELKFELDCEIQRCNNLIREAHDFCDKALEEISKEKENYNGQ